MHVARRLNGGSMHGMQESRSDDCGSEGRTHQKTRTIVILSKAKDLCISPSRHCLRCCGFSSGQY
jgi:hypothetical protein